MKFLHGTSELCPGRVSNSGDHAYRLGLPAGSSDHAQGLGRKDARSLRAVQVRSVEQVHAQAIHSR